MIRPAVVRLVELGPLPREDSDRADVPTLEKYENALNAIERPVSREEALRLVRLFGPEEDSCFGLAWTLLHLIESCGDGELLDTVDDYSPWIRRMREGAERRRALDAAGVADDDGEHE